MSEQTFTAEQTALLAQAAEGHVLVTVVGSKNDILWGELSDRGWMEPGELPAKLARLPGLNWHAWKMTMTGIETIKSAGASP